MASDTVVQYVLKVDSKGAQKGLDGTSKSADKLSKSLDKLQSESSDTNEGLEDTGQSSTKASKGINKLEVASKAAKAGIAAVATAAVATVGTIVALGAAYITAQKAAFNFTKEVVDSINDLNDLSAQSGLTAGSIQAVTAAFEGSGQSAGAAASFVSRFPKLFADLASGAGRASEAAARLGVGLTDAAGNMKSADEILIDVTRGLQAVKDPTERATEGFLLFGRSAGQFLQAFGATSEFENFLAITERFGVKTGPEASAAAAKFQEQLAFLNVVVGGLKQQFVESVGGVNFFNDKLLKAIKIVVTLQDFIADNKELFKEFGESLAQTGGDLIGFLQSMIGPFAMFVNTAFKIVNRNVLLVASAMNAVGALSDTSFLKLINGAESAEKSMFKLTEIITRLGDVDFSGATGRGLGGRTGASDVEGLLAKLLKGLGDGAGQSRPPVDGLTESIEKLGKESKKSDSQVEKNLLGALGTIEDFSKKFSGIDPTVQKSLDDIEELQQAILDLGIAGFSAVKAQGLLAKAELDLADAREEVTRKARAEQKKQRQDQIGGVVSDIAAVASLDAASIIGLINPIAGAITGALISIGEKSPQQMREEIEAQAQALAKGISILPELFIQIIPQLALAITEAIIDGFLNIFINLKKLIEDAFFIGRRREGGERRGARREDRRDFLMDFIDPTQSASYASGGRFIPKAQGGIRFTGMEDGLAQLHRGEFVVPQSGQRPQQVDRQLNNTTGGGMTININSAIVDRNAVDALVREIEIRFNNQFGTSSSSLFGGR